MLDKELFDLPPDDEPEGPSAAAIAACIALWLVVVLIGCGLVKLAEALS